MSIAVEAQEVSRVFTPRRRDPVTALATGRLALALLTFGRFMARGKRDGSLEYAS